MEIPVYYQEKTVGQADVAAEGLYIRISVTARGLPEEILRAWAITEDASIFPLGVLALAGAVWTASRRFPAASMPGAIRICEISSEMPELEPPSGDEAPAENQAADAAQWRDFDGAALRCQTPGARCRQAGDGLEIQIPYDPAIPCELVPLFCFFSMAEEDGRRWLRLLLDANGEPVLPAPAGT